MEGGGGAVVHMPGESEYPDPPVGGSRTDTIMLLHLPSNHTKPTMVSLLRDSYVTVPGHDKSKINAAFAIGGPQLLVRTVEANTGLRIDHYAEIGLGGFAN